MKFATGEESEIGGGSVAQRGCPRCRLQNLPSRRLSLITLSLQSPPELRGSAQLANFAGATLNPQASSTQRLDGAPQDPWASPMQQQPVPPRAGGKSRRPAADQLAEARKQAEGDPLRHDDGPGAQGRGAKRTRLSPQQDSRAAGVDGSAAAACRARRTGRPISSSIVTPPNDEGEPTQRRHQAHGRADHGGLDGLGAAGQSRVPAYRPMPLLPGEAPLLVERLFGETHQMRPDGKKGAPLPNVMPGGDAQHAVFRRMAWSVQQHLIRAAALHPSMLLILGWTCPPPRRPVCMDDA